MSKVKSHKIISRDERILGGIPVFRGSRVPVKALWDYLRWGNSIEEFLADFPSVSREQVVGILRRAEDRIINH